MIKLYVMRHGPAEDQSPSGRDADRALTTAGRDRVRSVARALLGEKEVPETIFTSHLLRSVQTAEIVATLASIDVVETHREIAPGGDLDSLVRGLVRERRSGVMVVGHEPDLSGAIARWVGRSPPEGMLKAMVVGVSFDEPRGDARLRFILHPKTLRWSHADARG